MADDDTAPRDIDEDACWELLEIPGLSRLAFVAPDGAPDIRPVNHRAFERAVYLRTAFDAKFLAIASEADVALEIDGEDADSYWSVIVRGRGAQVTSEEELHHAGVVHLESWTPAPKQFVVRITPSSVSGRRFAKTAHRTPPVYAVPQTESARAAHAGQRAERPSPIAHFEPSTPSDAASSDTESAPSNRTP